VKQGFALKDVAMEKIKITTEEPLGERDDVTKLDLI
jgi:hypothetical protein